MFNPLTYAGTIPESHGAGNPIPGLIVSATDPVEGHTISYSVVNTFEGGSFFSVDSNTGQISLAHEVDFEIPDNRLLFFQVC